MSAIWPSRPEAVGVDAGPKLKGRLEKVGKFTLEIAEQSDHAEGFEVLPRLTGQADKHQSG